MSVSVEVDNLRIQSVADAMGEGIPEGESVANVMLACMLMMVVTLKRAGDKERSQLDMNSMFSYWWNQVHLVEGAETARKPH